MHAEVGQGLLDVPELGLVAELARHRDGLVIGQLEQVGTLVQRCLGEVVDVRAGVAALGGRLALGAGQDAAAEVVHLRAGVVDVVLGLDVGARGLEQPVHGVAEGGPPGVPQVQRPGRVGRDELEVDDLTGGRVVVPVCRPGRHDGARQLACGRGVDGDVEEPRAGDVDGLDPGQPLEALSELRRDLARRHTGALGELEGDVRGPVPVLAVLRSLHAHLGRRGRREVTGVDGLGQGGADGEREFFGSHPRKSRTLARTAGPRP